LRGLTNKNPKYRLKDLRPSNVIFVVASQKQKLIFLKEKYFLQFIFFSGKCGRPIIKGWGYYSVFSLTLNNRFFSRKTKTNEVSKYGIVII